MMRVYSLSVRNRAAATVVGVAALGLGAVFLTLGFALLLGLVAAGVVVGAGVAGYRMLRGSRGLPKRSFDQYHSLDGERDAALDPSLEVKPPVRAIVRPLDDRD
jgi:hypothetical protein